MYLLLWAIRRPFPQGSAAADLLIANRVGVQDLSICSEMGGQYTIQYSDGSTGA